VRHNGLVEDIVLGAGAIFRAKSKIFDRTTMALVHCFFLEFIVFRESGVQVLGGECTIVARVRIQYRIFFLFFVSFFLFWLCMDMYYH
jgi:hypothetical protein